MDIHEEFVRRVADSFYTSLPCKVVEYDGETRFAKCELMVKTLKEGNTPLIRVPILRMVGGSVPLKVGMIIPVWFTKYAMGEFIVGLTQSVVKGSLECLQFQRSSAFGLPFLFDDKLNVSMPEFVEFDTRVIFKETVLMEKEVECLKDVSMRSSLTIDQDLTVKGQANITGNATIQGKMSSPNYDSHIHKDAEGRNTTTPQ